MLILGVDPSLTGYGWALHDTEAPVGTAARCPDRGRFSTSARMEFIDRYVFLRESLDQVLRRAPHDRVGLEQPVFGNLYSEGMYGLFLFTCEALKRNNCDVVLWTPLQIKAHARDSIDRPPKWKMEKPDMVEAARNETGGGKWNHNEADAYWIAQTAARFWLLHDRVISPEELTPTEKAQFTTIHTYQRGKRAGQTVAKGVLYREEERFFRWSLEEE